MKAAFAFLGAFLIAEWTCANTTPGQSGFCLNYFLGFSPLALYLMLRRRRKI